MNRSNQKLANAPSWRSVRGWLVVVAIVCGIGAPLGNQSNAEDPARALSVAVERRAAIKRLATAKDIEFSVQQIGDASGVVARWISPGYSRFYPGVRRSVGGDDLAEQLAAGDAGHYRLSTPEAVAVTSQATIDDLWSVFRDSDAVRSVSIVPAAESTESYARLLSLGSIEYVAIDGVKDVDAVARILAPMASCGATTLDLNECALDARCGHAIGQMSRLRTLRFAGREGRYDPETLTLLGSAASLRVIECWRDSVESTGDLLALTAHAQATTLLLAHAPAEITDETLIKVADQLQLTGLGMIRCRGIELARDGLAPRFGRLREIEVDAQILATASDANLAFPSAIGIRIFGAPAPDQIQRARRLCKSASNLRGLVITLPRTQAASATLLRACCDGSQIKFLGLEFGAVGIDAIAYLSEMRSLRHLNLLSVSGFDGAAFDKLTKRDQPPSIRFIP